MENKTLEPEYFDKIYAANDDPWNFATSEYEAEKYAATLDALPRPIYRNAFEIGCSIGVLTEKLAARCEKLLSADVSDKALNKAKQRCANLKNVRFEKIQVPKQFPVEKFDLILISEVGYYLSPSDWQKTLEKVFAGLTENGHFALVHWTPPVEDYPQTGDAVHDSFAEFAEGKFEKAEKIRREKYRLEVWEKLN